MITIPMKYMDQGELLTYCDKRRSEITEGKHKGYRDNSRGIEFLRKNIFPLRWDEKKVDGCLKFIYIPELENRQKDKIVEMSHKNTGFSQNLIKKRMEEAKYICEWTGLPLSNGKLAADHFFPKESGGKSCESNCVILNKILNEKKNKHHPLDWFIKGILTNFLNICNRAMNGDINSVKEKLIEFIKDF